MFLFLLALTVLGWAAYFLFLVAFPLLCLWLSWKAGKLLNRTCKVGAFQYVLPFACAVLPSLWAVAGFYEFKDSCYATPKPIIHQKAGIHQDGFYVETSALEKFGAWRTLPTFDYLIDSNKFLFYEQLNTRGLGPNPPGMTYRRTYQYTDRSLGRNSENTDVLKSAYAFTVLRVRRMEKWWLPSIYNITYGIRELSSNKVLAEANENIYGGWIFGIYRRAIIEPKNSHDGDFNFLGCGYAAQTIGLWRPPFSSQPEYAQYLEADSTLLRAVLSSGE